MSDQSTPGTIDGPYEELASKRARRARLAFAQEVTAYRLFADSAFALENAAGALMNAAAGCIALDGKLLGLFAEQAGALLAVAARFEEAADRSRSPDCREGSDAGRRG